MGNLRFGKGIGYLSPGTTSNAKILKINEGGFSCQMNKNFYYHEVEHRSYINPSGDHINYLKDDGPLLTCRLCGKDEKETTFHLKAHCVPESFGNKALLSLRECDRCNKDLFAKYDSEIGRFTSLFRAGEGIKGKKGVAEFRKNDLAIKNKIIDGKREATVTFFDPNLMVTLSDNVGERKTIKAETKDRINTMWVYKSLLKSALVLCGYPIFQELKGLVPLLFEAKTTTPSYFGIHFGMEGEFEGYSLFQMQSADCKGYPKYIAMFSCGSMRFFLPLLMKTDQESITNFIALFALDFQMKRSWLYEAVDDPENTVTAGGALSGAIVIPEHSLQSTQKPKV